MEPTKPAPSKHKAPTTGIKITRYLPRATTFTVPSRPYSPGRASGVAEAGSATRSYPNQQPNGTGYPHHHHHRPSFSGPISIVPPEARQRKAAGADPVEPTSPKVSCMGQVKRHKDAACRAAREGKEDGGGGKGKGDVRKRVEKMSGSGKPPKFVLMRFLRSKSSRSQAKEQQEYGGDEAVATGSAVPPAPPLGQLRRFASGRNALAGFDWRSANAAICPLETPVGAADSPDAKARPGHESDLDDDDHGYYGLHKGVADDDDDSCKIPHSAPMVLGGGGTAGTQPTRNQHQVNLWKRRTMPPPKPLQLN